ncbi:MAG: gliding motility-associated C-terminal domain-containing protein [Bacteroidales bacterium]|nr:gliding motility-associated C-terminal domain-containing protein [Bacteroidales bacterium]
MRNIITRLSSFFSVVAVVMMVMCGSVKAQTITVGSTTDNSTYTYPFNCFYKNSWQEMIFTQAEMASAAGCNITKIAFHDASGTGSTYTVTAATIKIYMGERTTASHSSSSDWTPIGDLSLVYSGTNVTLGNQASGNWQTFTLTTPFSYTGAGNLVVVVAKTNTGDYNSSCTWYYQTSVTGSEYPTLYRQSDSDNTYGTTHPGTSTGSQMSARANTRFTYSGCCSVQRTGTFEFRDASNNVVTTINHVLGNTFSQPTLVNNLTPAGTPTYSSSNPEVATVNSTTGAVTLTGLEGIVVITAYVPVSGSTCAKSVSYTIDVGDGCRKIGDGTSTQYSAPIYGNFKNSYDQIIYTAEEIGTAGRITSIGFNSSSSNSVRRTVDIYIGETNRTSFSSSTDWIPVNQLEHVYGPVTWDITAGWNVFQLPEAFIYTGVGNLVIAMDCAATDYSSTSFYYTPTTNTSVIYCYSDTYDAVPATITSYSGTTGTSTSRPNLKLCIEPCDIVPVDFGFSNSLAMCYLGGQPTITLDRGGNNGELVWSSSDPTVATIDENGIITTHSLGTTTISVVAPIDGDVCSARDSYELQVICPAHIPSAQSVSVCSPQPVDLTATVRDDEGNLELQWFDDVLADSPIYTGDTYHTDVTATTTYYVAAYNTDQHCYSSRVPSTVHVFDVQYDATTTNESGYVGVPMYGYPPEGSHEGATFTANGMPAWLTLNSDGSFSGTPTAAGSGSFTITATNAMGCSVTRTINWTVAANNLGCCDFESFYIYQDNKPFPLHLADDGYYYADVCLNTPMTLRVQKLNNCSGNYSYTWRLTSSTGGLIQEFTGTQFTYTYDRTAGYGVMLQIRRNNSDCISIPVRVRVAGVFQVATRPSFNLCHGEPFNIYVSTDGVGAIDVVRPSGGAATTLGVSDTILLPDGEPCNGNCFYRSSVTFSDFSAGATIRNANDLLYVMLNIEHTFIGDIYIAITCPSGRRSVILSQCGSGSATCHAQIPSGYDSWVSGVGTSNHGVNFGEPNSGNSTSCDPTASGNELGVGWNYIWSENTNRGYVYAGGTGLIYDDANVHNSTVDSSDLANMSQIYVPQETFDNLITCPLNGTWSIEVVDGWSGDNGHIFNWELGLNEELLPDSWSYTVDLDSSWVTCGWNSTKSGVYMEITPPDNFNGTESCDLFLRDEYGCTSTYENIVTVTMNPTVHSTEEVNGQCEPYTWARNNQTYTTSGTYVDAGLTPAGCPDTATLVLSISGSVSETVNAQACESYTWSANGQTYTQSGTYTANLTTAMGCDSIVTLNLTISNEITVEFDTTICPDNFPLNNWHGDWGDFTAAGDLQQHFTTTSGCDSTVTLHVHAYPKPNLTITAPDGAGGCPRMSGNYVITPNITNAQTPYIYEWHGNQNSYTGNAATATIPANGTCTEYADTLYLTDANGCKDTATVSFSTVDGTNPAFTTTFDDVDAEVLGYDCRYRVPDIIALLQPTDNCGIAEMIQTPLPGNDIDDNTDVHITIEDHCGNRATWDVEVKVPQPLTANELDHTNVSCTGANDGTVTLSGVAGGSPQYHYAWTSSGAGATNVTSQTGTSLSNLAPGTYTVTITDDAECSIEKSVTVDVDGAASTGVETYVVCDQFTWHGVTYTSSNNTATYTTTNAAGCDSVVTLNLTVNHSNNAIYTTTACETYEWHGVTYTESTNTPTYTTTNAAGCDSTTTLNLTVYHNDYQVHYATACDTYTWTIRGHNYTRTNSDVIVDTYTIGTCTGADTLHLTINHSSSGVDEEVACNTYTWYRNGQTYTNSTNTPSITLPNGNSFGCDSTIVLHLTINRSTSGIDAHTACDSYTWPMNSMTYTYSTNAPNVYAGLNNVGCDSTVYLHLTISHASSSVFPVTRCDTYTWPMNGQTYTYSTNTPQVTIQNHAGCDSTITLHLTINNTRYGSYVDTVCSGESLIYRGHAYPAGNHTVTITATNGCDSIVALQVVPRMPITVNIEEYHTCELGHYIVTGSINADVNHIWSCQPSDPDLFNQRHDLEIEVNPPQITDYTLNAGYGISMLCQVTATIRLAPLDLPVAGIAFQKPFLTCDDLDWTATSTSQNTQQVTWYVNDIQVSNENTISGRALCDDDSVRFSLLAVNGICTDVLDTVLYVRKSQLWFPNVFTPNLNINKTFNAIGRGIIEYELYIYTREGLLVFHTTNLEEGWRGDHNGIECPRSTYTYIARYRNEIEPDVWHKQIGTVTLLR